MTTHLRARAVQAGAFLALVGGMLVVASSPAQANAPDVQITGLTPTVVQSGGTTTLQFTVVNNNQTGGLARIDVTGGLSCSPREACNQSTLIDAKQSRQFSVTLTAPQVDAGQTRTFQVQVSAAIGPESSQPTNPEQVTVRGADKPQTVRQVVGRVVDQDGKALAGASVGLRDIQRHEYRTTSNNDGRFQFTSSDDQPILAGALSVAALKDGYDPQAVSKQGGADKTVQVTLTMVAKETTASASPSASPTASPTADDALADPATVAASPPAAAGPENTSQNTGSSSSKLFIIVGALLVAAGIGAIVLLVMRRRNNRDDDPDDPVGGGGPAGPVPSQGRFNGIPDATRVAAPAGSRMNDATIVAAPSIADAPTMMQRAVPIDDEFPDPYGVPVAPQGGYAGSGGYGTTAAGTYGAGAYGGAQVPAQPGGYEAGPPTQYGRPPAHEDDPYGTYSAPQSGGAYSAPDQPHYDEPTGMYRPAPADGRGGSSPDQVYGAGGYRGVGQGGDYGREPEYPPPAAGRARGETTGGYQPGGYSGGGYGGAPEPSQPDQGGYGSWGPPGGGVDSGNAYGPPAGGGYGPAAGPYSGGSAGNAPGTYGGAGTAGDQGGYDPRATYGRPDSYNGPAPQQRGSDPAPAPDGPAPGGGYYGDQGGGRHGGQSRQQPPPPDPARPGQRRPIDWLDD